MDVLAQAETTPIRDNRVLDEFEIPVGSWFDQIVDWIDTRLGEGDDSWFSALSWIKWPFEFLLENLVDDWLLGMSWTTLCIGIFLIGYLVRNAKVGFGAAMGLAGCGLLGNQYWLETARTVGFIGVAVLLCIIVGIPLGIACGRMDGLWGVVRPVLDAMQVVHSFVYMVPFIFFFGIGAESATMVTMVFALPPLIRLTNLGIRQVPEDVVEASRAYGAPEWRVLSDVQLPLARPAIMTGMNQTLLLAISMLGIAAIMGAGGLGRLLFQALSNLDVAQGASAGLAFFLVAVVLDRLSQPEDDDGQNLFARLARAWANRSTPEALMPEAETHQQIELPDVDERVAPVGVKERKYMLIAGAGGILGLISVVLDWSKDSGRVSAHGRRSDEDLLGQAFDGLNASGGTWFGYALFGCALFIVYAVIQVLLPRGDSIAVKGNDGLAFVLTSVLGIILGAVLFDATWFIIVFGLGFGLVRPGLASRWVGADGVVIASIGGLLVSLGYLLIGTSEFTESNSHGVGVYVAIIAGVVAVAGSILWMWNAPYAAHRPLSAKLGVGRLIGVGFAVLVLLAAGFSGWSFDERADTIISPELQAQIDEWTDLGRAEPENAAVYAANISAAMASAQVADVVVRDGFTGSGSGLGTITLVLGLLGLAATLPAAGAFGRDEEFQYRWSAVASGLGIGLVLVTVAWIVSLARVAGEENIVSGAGAFMALAGGFFILAANRGTVAEFFRANVYGDDGPDSDVAQDETSDEELATV